MAADIKWIKITIDMFENEKIEYILSLENGDAIFLIWFQLYLKVKRKATNVYTTFANLDTPIDEILSIVIGESKEMISLAISELTKLGMLEVNNNEIKVIAPWLSNQHYRTTAEYTTWRSLVFERDDYTCQHCRTKGNKLNAHHIKSFADYKELRFEVSNGLTLCEECHSKEHVRIREVGELWQT
ncbi:phage replisome organizer N-terminal domain-containing protein [Paenibacillus sp. HWE-109]|uniref:phage replisome organizer N-terminal domain-containing protein n=1 Tax=Paenibacillus sp. HWE-109 TaxID=1306526 RepID=UPI001EE12347|nr:phage replisome organizer N-terminal domain-containing protein [Paenibacillus sp. HWE-109]UKS25043.1 phage replisome organizer N-terminal domain-containing protein [Paenibacillus sp. HWE-109]